MKSIIDKKFEKQTILLFLLLFLIIFFSIFSNNFFSIKNIIQIVVQMVELSLITLGMSVCMISGGFDLSIGAITGLGSVCFAMLIKSGMNMWISILIVFLFLVLCGLINGILIGFMKINPMLATLGTSSLFTGIALAISKGTAVSGLPEKFYIFGQHYIGIIPLQALILLVIFVISLILLKFTKWGRRVHLIGSNPEVAKFAGINCEINIMFVYVYSTVLAFFASLVLTSRLATGRADLGNIYVLQSASAAILGGIDIKGGSGSISGAIIGVAIFTIITNGFNKFNISQYEQQIVIGCILIGVLAYKM